MTTPPTNGNEADRSGELLSRALHEEAAMVQTDPGALQAIRERTRGTSRHRSPWVLGTLGAGLATAAVITAVALVGGQDQNDATPPAATRPTGGTVTESGRHEGHYDPSSESNAPMTYVGQPSRSGDVRLYSEPHTLATGEPTDPVAAVHEFLTSTPIDADYRSGWPEGVDISGITAEGGTTVIALTGSGELAAPAGSSPSERAMAVQAIARTAGLQPSDSIGFTYNGDPVDSVLGVDLPATVKADDDTRAWITIDSIVEGQTVSSPVTVTVSGNVFEGNVNWKLLGAGGAKGAEGFVTTSMGMWTQAPIKLGSLDAGTYTLRVVEYSMEDGSPMNADDKTFTVE